MLQVLLDIKTLNIFLMNLLTNGETNLQPDDKFIHT